MRTCLMDGEKWSPCERGEVVMKTHGADLGSLRRANWISAEWRNWMEGRKGKRRSKRERSAARRNAARYRFYPRPRSALRLVSTAYCMPCAPRCAASSMALVERLQNMSTCESFCTFTPSAPLFLTQRWRSFH